jgi:hypothetical protein
MQIFVKKGTCAKRNKRITLQRLLRITTVHLGRALNVATKPAWPMCHNGMLWEAPIY